MSDPYSYLLRQGHCLLAVGTRDANELRSSGGAIHQSICVLLFLLREEVAQRVDIVAEPIGKFSSDGTHFIDDRIFSGGFHVVNSSSGVQTIGGS